MKKTPGPGDFTIQFKVLHTFFQRIEKGGKLANWFYEVRRVLIPKPCNIRKKS